jgi:hypothetical protein
MAANPRSAYSMVFCDEVNAAGPLSTSRRTVSKCVAQSDRVGDVVAVGAQPVEIARQWQREDPLPDWNDRKHSINTLMRRPADPHLFFLYFKSRLAPLIPAQLRVIASRPIRSGLDAPFSFQKPLPWRGNVIRCHAAFESPVTVFTHEDIVVAAGLRDYRFAVGARGDESPTRPGGRAVALNDDFEV